jgi:hypothetical protein
MLQRELRKSHAKNQRELHWFQQRADFILSCLDQGRDTDEIIRLTGFVFNK